MSKPTAAQLKDEGNEFFRKQDYVGALAKYTEAIALDDKNAILYANRAACQYELNRYLDAVDDAKMATQIDPGYAKAWSRLAASRGALADFEGSAEAWQKALDALPKTNLSPAEQRQKDQYGAGLNAAQTPQTRGKTSKNRCIASVNLDDGNLPWKIATEMLPELRKAGLDQFSSSAWVISYAYEEFTKGVESMNQLKSIPHSQAPGGLSYHGNLMGLTYLTNGLMRDERVFHLNHPDWITKYNNQGNLILALLAFEATAHQAYSGGVETIKELIQKRLKEKGWNDVRPALSVTVRKWIMKGMLESHLGGRPDTGVHFLKRAVDLLEWGRLVWKDVHKDDRGVIFEDTFLRSVRSMHLMMSMNAYSSGPSLNSHLEHLKEEAEDLLKEIDIMIASNNLSKEKLDPGMVSSFCVYPAAIAHKTIGFYHSQKARYSDGVLACISYMNGVNAYLQAANTYPENDEFHAFYLTCAMDCMRNAGVSIGDFNTAAIALRAAVPKMMKIWAFSIMQRGGRDEKIQAHLRRADEMMKLVAEGKLTLEDPVPF
ncbi:uncharacterized protein F5891DRAFT_1282054 [Suillus fuscotomentosus]|uniref:TPR-like protein n=1 Tax=Suillus fuscotomentosus TaxID=1912939 RepID=A0AAD4DT63_9AGAM|nr:uncharacterized protein F5891DRAFT_1282054 [Suillus fuscotomentosus]KAG1893485.1 hypothetical protein F5891DRAFT_1282054 [Suillus fuscotomentosus]